MTVVRSLLFSAAVAGLSVAGCKSDKEETASEAETPAQEPTTKPPEPTPPEPPVETEVAIPTPEDFEEVALIEITADNLEAELKKLEDELD